MPFHKDPFGVWQKDTVALQTLVAPATPTPTSTTSPTTRPKRQPTIREMWASNRAGSSSAQTPTPQEATPIVANVQPTVATPPRLSRDFFGVWRPVVVIHIPRALVEDENVAPTPPPAPLPERSFAPTSPAQPTSAAGKIPSASRQSSLKGLKRLRSVPYTSKHTSTMNGSPTNTQTNAQIPVV